MNYPLCNRPSHDGEIVKAVCLSEDCNELKAVCFKCVIEHHQNCLKSIKTIAVIP